MFKVSEPKSMLLQGERLKDRNGLTVDQIYLCW